MSDSTKQALEAQLEALVEANGDAGEIGALISQIDSMGEEPVELTAKALEIEPTVVVPAEPQPELPVEKENTDMQLTLTKESLGIGSEFTSALNALDLATIKSALIEVQDTDNLSALVVDGVSKLDSEHRIHVERRGEIRRAARGFALFAAGGVENGQITSPDGSLHYVEDGICYEKSETKQPDSFTAGFATIERIVPCLGHLEYRKVGEKFVKTGGEYTRCLHQWALMFAGGFFITFNRELYSDVIITEAAQRVGDEDAREVAKAQIEEWQQNRQANFESRKTVAQAIVHTKNKMGLGENEPLPAAPDVLNLELPDGKTVKDAVLALGGARFVATFELPINGETSRQKVRAGSLSELASRVAPIYAAARMQQLALVPVEVKVAA